MFHAYQMAIESDQILWKLQGKSVLHWLRNDQRIQDHVIFSNLDEFTSVTVFYVHPPKYDGIHSLGFDLISEKRKNFLNQSLTELKDSLEKKGVKLHVFFNLEELKDQSFHFDILTFQKLYGTEEIEQENEVLKCFKSKNLVINDFTLVSQNSLPFSLENLPQVFTAFRKKIERVEPYQKPVSNVELPKVSEPFRLMGGENQALNRLTYYFFESRRLSLYKETRNGMVGTDYSSRLSPWLANGNISARTIFEKIEQYESAVTSNSSTYWLKFELFWRDFFQLQLQLHGASFFKANGVRNIEKKFLKNERIFWKWAEGKTGNDLVDANMKELNSTGWMSNRGRQNVASYLIHDLGIHWRWGAAYFESKLIDYDPASNWGNWMYIAGLGHDPRPFRKFNTKSQAERYDPDRIYRDLWLK